MATKITRGFWAKVARIILRNRILILIAVAAVTVFLGFQWEHMRFSNSEANLLPDGHPINKQYQSFLDRFGEEGNAISICEPEENAYVKDIEKLIKQKITVIKDNPFPQTERPMTEAEKKEWNKEKERRKQEFFRNRKKNRMRR